jgi:plastocyanin
LLGALLAAVVLAAAVGGMLGALATGVLGGPGSNTVAPSSPSAPGQRATMPATDGGGGMGKDNAAAPIGGPAAASDAGAFYAGRAMRGNGDRAIPLSRAQQLAAEVPAGAIAERSSNTLRFTSAEVGFVALASPPGHGMTFRIAGMTDPTIEVPQGAQVTVDFINGDSDMAHMWLLARSVPASGPHPTGGLAGPIAGGRPLGDPTSAGQPSETIGFQAPAPGTYHYYCAFPGHAAMGMQGQLRVVPS